MFSNFYCVSSSVGCSLYLKTKSRSKCHSLFNVASPYSLQGNNRELTFWRQVQAGLSSSNLCINALSHSAFPLSEFFHTVQPSVLLLLQSLTQPLWPIYGLFCWAVTFRLQRSSADWKYWIKKDIKSCFEKKKKTPTNIPPDRQYEVNHVIKLVS